MSGAWPRARLGIAALALPPLALASWLVLSRLSASPRSGDLPAAIPDAVPDPSEALPGGATTLARGKRPGLAELAPHLALRRKFDLSVGRAFFRDPWIAAPATTTARDGLGPVFNAHSCAACHLEGGRARAGAASPPDAAPGLVLRLGGTRPAAAHERVAPDPVYGDEIQTRGIAASAASEAGAGAPERAVAEGAPRVAYGTIAGRFADGESYELRRPRWQVDDLAYGPLDRDTSFSARLAPALAGVGLLESIREEDVVAHADPDDRDGDGVSGRPNRVWDAVAGREGLGRFGWKASQASVRQQVAAAFRADIGITSEVYREQPCTAAEAACARAPSGADPKTGVEIDALLLERVTDFVALLGIPARARADAAEVVQGRSLFRSIGCASCHLPSFTTGDAATFPELAHQRVWPYTDLLLHDLGPGLADDRPDFAASGSEWRTAPLWGIGFALARKEPATFLHDGRARDLQEAILWHGGEAERARDRFAALSRTERQALLAFLGSL